MKGYLDDEDEEEDDEEENLKSYTSLIFNAQTPTTKPQLLATLPERPAVDLLVSRYFNSNSPALRKYNKPATCHVLNCFSHHTSTSIPEKCMRLSRLFLPPFYSLLLFPTFHVSFKVVNYSYPRFYTS